MSANTDRMSIVRDQNHRHYGTPDVAREYAADTGAVFCEGCHVVFEPAPENEGLGHDCPA